MVQFPGLHIASWRGIAPELGYADTMMDLVMTIFLVIIMLALAFGIVNTMLMAVLERKKELGMLISVGMNKRKVFLDDRMGIYFSSSDSRASRNPIFICSYYIFWKIWYRSKFRVCGTPQRRARKYHLPDNRFELLYSNKCACDYYCDTLLYLSST